MTILYYFLTKDGIRSALVRRGCRLGPLRKGSPFVSVGRLFEDAAALKGITVSGKIKVGNLSMFDFWGSVILCHIFE